MSFNPISIDDGASRSANARHHQPPRREHLNDSANQPSAFLGSMDTPHVLTASTPVATALRRCTQHYFFNFKWSVPFPQQPDAPLLYLPDVYKEILSDPAAVGGVMQSELDAMSEGVLNNVPLVYYPLNAASVAEARAIAKQTESNIAAMQREAQAAGQLEKLTWKPTDVNPLLEKEDADILDTDIDSSLVLQRDLPSLTLLQRPLYTDMGLIPQDQRHAARLARIVPEDLRSFSQAAGLPGSPMSPASPQNAAGNGVSAVAAFETPEAVETRQRMWLEDVGRSFRFARQVDKEFSDFLKAMTQDKLGLDKTQVAHASFTRTLWQTLFQEGTSALVQRGLWNHLCRFSSDYGEIPHEGWARKLVDIEIHPSRPLPFRFAARWRDLCRQYAKLVLKYVTALSGGVEARKQHLHFSDAELDGRATQALLSAQERGAAAAGWTFQAELAVPAMLQRHGVPGPHGAKTVFPVEVIPIFPSGFDRAADAATGGVNPAKSQSGDLDYLAEAGEELHHVVLPGAALNPANSRGAHVLVGGTNLLVADSDTAAAATSASLSSSPGESVTVAAAAGATVSYHTSHENTFQPLLVDDENTSSYILCVRQSAKLAATGSGATNADSKYVTYDRIGTQDLFTKASAVEEPPFNRYVMMFGEEYDRQSLEQQGGQASAKREREVEGEGVVLADAPTVKRERAEA